MRQTFPGILAFLLALGLALPCAAQDSSDDEETSEEGGLDSPSDEGEAEAEPEAPAEEEAPAGPSNAFLGDLSLGVIGVAFEHLIEDAVAIHIAAQFYAPWYQNDGGTYGVGGELRLFWFLGASGYEGAYLSPGFRAAYVFHEDDAGSRDGYALGGRMSIGYGWLFDSFTVRFGVGGQYETVDMTELDGQVSEDFGTTYLVLDLYLGWAG